MLRTITEVEVPEIKRVAHELTCIMEAVSRLSTIYERSDWLNDTIDIGKVIPMSLDDWDSELFAKIIQLDEMTNNKQM